MNKMCKRYPERDCVQHQQGRHNITPQLLCYLVEQRRDIGNGIGPRCITLLQLRLLSVRPFLDSILTRCVQVRFAPFDHRGDALSPTGVRSVIKLACGLDNDFALGFRKHRFWLRGGH